MFVYMYECMYVKVYVRAKKRETNYKIKQCEEIEIIEIISKISMTLILLTALLLYTRNEKKKNPHIIAQIAYLATPYQ